MEGPISFYSRAVLTISSLSYSHSELSYHLYHIVVYCMYIICLLSQIFWDIFLSTNLFAFSTHYYHTELVAVTLYYPLIVLWVFASIYGSI